MKKGQISTEYLVIMAVILVIALVVVYLMSQSTGVATSTLETQSQAYWKTASPLAITGFSASGTTLTLAVLNTAPETITLTQLSGSGVTTFSTATPFPPGNTQVIRATLTSSCSSGSRYSVDNVTLTYSQGSIIGKTFIGQKSFTGSCS